jgi:hypothetical protein
MTSNESEPTTAGESAGRGLPADENEEARIQRLEQQVRALQDELTETKEELDEAKTNLRWMAQHQASETGKSVCPYCNAGGALYVERTATGKKKVECSKCGERMV